MNYIPPPTEEAIPVEVSAAVPHSREAEEAVIGAVFINSEVYWDIAQFLNASDFYIHRHGWIWESFVRLQKKKVPIDLLTVTDDLEKHGQMNEIGGPASLTALINQVPSSLNAESYARIVEGYAIRRKMIAAANTIAQNAYNEKIELASVQKEAWKAIEQVAGEGKEGGLQPIKYATSRVYDHVDERSKSPELTGVPTGFIDLDKMLCNMQGGDFLIIAGRPGQGKTGFLLDVAHNNTVAAKKGSEKKVALFEMEMSDESIVHRLISKETGIDSQRIRQGRLYENEWSLFTRAIETLSASGIFIDDTPAVTPLQLLARARSMQMREGLDLVIADYLQLADGNGDVHKSRNKNDNREQEVSYISRMLKLTARSLNVPVLAAAQLSRSVEQRADHRPVLSDLRESGSLEQNADVVMFIHRPDQYEKNAKQNVAEIIVAKQRNGPVGSVELTWRSALAKFENAAQKFQRDDYTDR